MITYVYGLVRGARRPSMRNVPPGVPGSGPIRALDAGEGLWIIAADVPPKRYDEAALAKGLPRLDWVGERAMAHEAVIEHFLRAPAVLPMQLFTLFTSDARALAHVAGDRRRIDRVLARIARHVEWGLRLTLEQAATPIEPAPASRRSSGGRLRRAESGAAYLSRKRDLVHVDRARLTQARAEGGRLYRAMAREATAALRRTATEQAAPGSRLIVDAAFLVPVRRTAAFRTALRQHSRHLAASGLEVSLTGPWPPYNFITSPPKRRAA